MTQSAIVVDMKNRINFLPFVLLDVMILSIAGCLFFGGRWCSNAGSSGFVFWGFFFSSFLAAETVIFHLVPPFSALLLFLISRDKNFLNSFWFREHAWEKKFYASIKVKSWKASVGTYDKRLFSGNNFSKDKLVLTMTQSELVHEIIFLMSFVPLKLVKIFGHLPLLVFLCVLFAAANLPFIFIQRYNRPRILKMKERKVSA